jgi:type IV pilus assembly protein PilC
MPLYRYQAIDKRGRNLNGLMPAQDEANLQERLKDLGLWLTEAVMERPGSITDNPPPTQSSFMLPRLRGKRLRRELIDFCTLMSFLVRSGMPLVKALEVAREDCTEPQFREVIGGLQTNIEAGLELHEALLRYPSVFTPHFVSVVRAGVVSSKLPETLKNLKEYLEWVDQVIGDVRQATLYPAIVLTVVVAFIGFLFTYIIPKFAVLLDKLHVEEPLVTRIVLGLSGAATATWWLWLPVFLFVVLGVPLARRYSPAFVLATDRIKLHLPVFGPLNLMLALSRFSHNLAILYQSGIPILEALNLCQRGLVGNAYVEAAVGKVASDVKTGSTISEAMHRQPVFSAMLVRMVGMGESTGRLDEALVHVADYYNDIIPRRIKALFTIMEPALMLFLIFTVGTVALAIYLPILSLMGSIH